MVDLESAKELNLLRNSPTFAMKHSSDGRTELVQPKIIPADEDSYTIAGESILPNGTRLSSVFTVEDGGGNLVKVFWDIGGKWYQPNDGEVPALLNTSRKELFPFNWTYSIPVANDIYHPSA